MRAYIFTIIISCLALSSSFGQIYTKPKYEKRSNTRVDITKIEKTKQYTIVHFKYTSDFEGVAHACIDSRMHIQDVKTMKKYNLIKTDKIPVCPRQYPFSEKGHTFHFQLYFEKIPYSTTYINIIENNENGFNFYKVYLKPSA